MSKVDQRGPLSRIVRRARLSFNYRVGRLQSVVICELKEPRLPRSEREREQEEKFTALGLDRRAGIAAIDKALRDSEIGRAHV